MNTEKKLRIATEADDLGSSKTSRATKIYVDSSEMLGLQRAGLLPLARVPLATPTVGVARHEPRMAPRCRTLNLNRQVADFIRMKPHPCIVQPGPRLPHVDLGFRV